MQAQKMMYSPDCRFPSLILEIVLLFHQDTICVPILKSIEKENCIYLSRFLHISKSSTSHLADIVSGLVTAHVVPLVVSRLERCFCYCYCYFYCYNFWSVIVISFLSLELVLVLVIILVLAKQVTTSN